MGVIIELAVDPIGTSSTSVSRYVKAAIEVIAKRGYKYQVGPMGTSVELPRLEDLGILIKEIHDTLNKMGVNRIVTVVRIDDRRDKEETMEYKVSKVSS